MTNTKKFLVFILLVAILYVVKDRVLAPDAPQGISSYILKNHGGGTTTPPMKKNWGQLGRIEPPYSPITMMKMKSVYE
jgi:hypothetical protein